MVKFLIASHGYLADGIKSTVRIIMGDEAADSIITYNAFVNEQENVKEEIEKLIRQSVSEGKLIVFTDLMHGSVNQFIVPYIDDKSVYLITGFNFPLVCEIIAKYVFCDAQTVDVDALKKDIEKAKNEMIYVNDLVKVKELSDEDEFYH